jgi:hypothetical protein
MTDEMTDWATLVQSLRMLEIKHETVWRWRTGRHVPRGRNAAILRSLDYAQQEGWDWHNRHDFGTPWTIAGGQSRPNGGVNRATVATEDRASSALKD